MGMKKVADPMDDPLWLAFRKALEVRGYTLKGLWHASDNIIIWVVSDGPNGEQPKHRTIVTRFYEAGGFGVWLESNTGAFDEGAAEIIGTAKPSDYVVMKDGDYLPGTITAGSEEAALDAARSQHGPGRYSVALVGKVAADVT